MASLARVWRSKEFRLAGRRSVRWEFARKRASKARALGLVPRRLSIRGVAFHRSEARSTGESPEHWLSLLGFARCCACFEPRAWGEGRLPRSRPDPPTLGTSKAGFGTNVCFTCPLCPKAEARKPHEMICAAPKGQSSGAIVHCVRSMPASGHATTSAGNKATRCSRRDPRPSPARRCSDDFPKAQRCHRGLVAMADSKQRGLHAPENQLRGAVLCRLHRPSSATLPRMAVGTNEVGTTDRMRRDHADSWDSKARARLWGRAS